MNKPANIYNGDETGLNLNNIFVYVLAVKGRKDVPELTSEEEVVNITALFTALLKEISSTS